MTLEVANETEGPTTFFTQIIARLRFVLPFLMSLQLTYNLKFIIIRLKIKYKQYLEFTFQNKSSATFVAQVVPFHTVSNQQVALHPGLFNQLVAHFAWHHGIFKTKEKKNLVKTIVAYRIQINLLGLGSASNFPFLTNGSIKSDVSASNLVFSTKSRSISWASSCNSWQIVTKLRAFFNIVLSSFS